jgi:flagellar biosynthesis component FlhA
VVLRELLPISLSLRAVVAAVDLVARVQAVTAQAQELAAAVRLRKRS